MQQINDVQTTCQTPIVGYSAPFAFALCAPVVKVATAPPETPNLDLDFDAFAVLLLAAPFVAAALAPIISRETGPLAGWILAIVPAGLFVNFLSLVSETAAHGAVRFGIDWVPVLGLRLSFLIDGLSLIFALLITGIGAAILIYSGAYLKGHAHRGRFLAFLLLFMGAMLGLVLADSLVALFAFWELTSVSSFLLIGFDHERPVARRAAVQALVVTGMGGLALLAGGVLLPTSPAPGI